MGARLDHVSSYYESLNSRDADLIASHFTDDAVHYYTRREPHVGARAIAENAVLAVEHIEGHWVLEHAIEGADEVAIEWSMAFRNPRNGKRCLDRGAEFLRFDGERICEIRAYYNERGGDLRGFDHEDRGHTVLETAA